MDQSARSEFAILHLDASDEKSKFSIEVISFEIEEALSTAFKSEIYFLSASPTLPFDDIVGRGAALSLHTGAVGDRVWAGVCTELELVHSEEHTGSPGGITEAMAAAGIGGPNYKGRSRYKLTIQPDLYRLSLRRNSRIFQGQNAVDIVKTVLKDWDIEVDDKLSKLTETHPVFDYKVQYQESDFDFVSRILEDAGISYWIQPHTVVPTTEKKKGNEITKLILRDAPANEPATYDGKKNVLPYLGDGPDKQHDMGPHIWMLSAKQQPKPLRKTIRDRDFRSPIDVPIENHKATTKDGRPAIEGKYESYEYQPGAYWFAGKGDGGVADFKNAARTDQNQLEQLPLRRYQAELAGRTLITFRTNAMDIEPSTVLQIGQNEFGYDHNHPHPAFAPDKKMLVIRRKITGEATGSHYSSELTAVYANEPYRPKLTTEKPRVFGVQSAVVVGPKGSEIYTDEFGRVRVQFVWDRYAQFDENSSCWVRVSQAWAGGGFGVVVHPRVGHEVLVGFFEGDPDQPVIVGRVHNASTKTPYFPATGANMSKSGIKTNTFPGGGGFNEMSFQDSAGSELIHIQGQKDITFVVNNNQSHDVGSALSYKVGSSESHDIGQSLTIKIGMTESHEMGQSFDIKVGIPGASTEFKMDQKSIVLSTGKASITLSEDNIFIEAEKEIHIHSGKKLHISSSEDVDVDAKSMTIDTKDNLLLNCETAEIHPAKAAQAGFAQPPAGPAHGSPGTPPVIPHYQGVPPVQPGGLEHVNVGDDIEEKKKPEAPKAPTSPTELVQAATDKAKDVAAKPAGLLGGIQDMVKGVDSTISAVKEKVEAVKAAVKPILDPVKKIVADVKSIEAKVKEVKAFIKDPGAVLKAALIEGKGSAEEKEKPAADAAKPAADGAKPAADAAKPEATGLAGVLGKLSGLTSSVDTELGKVTTPLNTVKGLVGDVGQIKTFIDNPLAALKGKK